MSGPDRVAALLRGINLGKRRITNEKLARLIEGAGIGGVAVYQASGNVIFDRPRAPLEAVERRFEAHLLETLGYPVDTFCRRLPELADLAAMNEVVTAEDEGFKVHVIFLHEPTPDHVRVGLASLATADDRFLTRGCHILWFRSGRLKDSTVPASDPGCLTGGRTSTMRTLGTVRRIVAKFGHG